MARASASTVKPWQQRHSPLARTAALLLVVLILHASLSPWTGWVDRGVSPLAWIGAPLPRHVTAFDLVTNVLGYLPLGALLVWALHPRVRGVAAVFVAVLLAAALSAGVESLQTFLRPRVASNLDFLANVGGALMGAALAAPVAAALIDRGRLADLRLRWFRRDATLALLLVALWPLAQVHATPMLFGNGQLRGVLGPVVTALGLDWPSPFANDFGPTEFALAEAFVTACGLLAVGLALASTLRPFAPRAFLLGGLLTAALATRTLAAGIQLGADKALSWLTPGAPGALALASLALLAASAGPPPVLRRVALLALLLLLAAVNVLPDNPYHTIVQQAWRPGRLLNFAAVAGWLSVAWPYALAAWLLLEPGREDGQRTSI